MTQGQERQSSTTPTIRVYWPRHCTDTSTLRLITAVDGPSFQVLRTPSLFRFNETRAREYREIPQIWKFRKYPIYNINQDIYIFFYVENIFFKKDYGISSIFWIFSKFYDVSMRVWLQITTDNALIEYGPVCWLLPGFV